MPAMTPAALKAEIDADPAALGYAALKAQGSDQGLADALNLSRVGTAADGKPYSVFRSDVAPKEVVNAIAPADFSAATALQVAKLQMVFVGAPLDMTLANVRGNLQGIFSGASTATTNALSAVASRNGSRAEALWGAGTAVSSSDVAAAYGRK